MRLWCGRNLCALCVILARGILVYFAANETSSHIQAYGADARNGDSRRARAYKGRRLRARRRRQLVRRVARQVRHRETAPRGLRPHLHHEREPAADGDDENRWAGQGGRPRKAAEGDQPPRRARRAAADILARDGRGIRAWRIRLRDRCHRLASRKARFRR